MIAGMGCSGLGGAGRWGSLSGLSGRIQARPDSGQRDGKKVASDSICKLSILLAICARQEAMTKTRIIDAYPKYDEITA